MIERYNINTYLNIYISIPLTPKLHVNIILQISDFHHSSVMNSTKQNLRQIEFAIQDLLAVSNGIRPTKGQIRWFSEGKHHQELTIFRNSVEDALNHASTFIGYFDGYEARGIFQIQTSKKSKNITKIRLLNILDFLNWVLLEFEEVIQKYINREDLTLCEKGPTKPGVQRTTKICLQHLKYLKKITCQVVFKITNDPDLQRKAQKYLNRNQNQKD
jgi:hypothetical protein